MDERDRVLTTVQFTCSDCAQTIEVNEEMRDTILETGCPVCTTAATEDDFGDDDESGDDSDDEDIAGGDDSDDESGGDDFADDE